MLKSISNLGTVLNKTEQESINGGNNISRCRFPDGTGWYLNYDERYQSNAADAACKEQGGEAMLW